MDFTNPAIVARLVNGGTVLLQSGSKISSIILNGDGANGGLLQVFDAVDASNAATLIAEVILLPAEKHKFDSYPRPIWGGGNPKGPLFCKLTGTGAVAYIAWE